MRSHRFTHLTAHAFAFASIVLQDRPDYVRIAAELGRDDARRVTMRKHILEHKDRLFHRGMTNPEVTNKQTRVSSPRRNCVLTSLHCVTQWAQFLEEAATNRPITNLHSTSVDQWLKTRPDLKN